MDTTTLHITELIGNQEIDFFGITSFKVQNHGEAVIDVNSIAIYPGETVKIIEEDGTKSDFRLSAKFSEAGKMPKFRVIYKQFGNISPIDTLLPINLAYVVTLLNYEQGDQFEFMQNQSGYVTLSRSFETPNVTNGYLEIFPDQNDIDLGFVEANTVVKYDQGGSLDTVAIRFTNNENSERSEMFFVNGNVMPVGLEPFYNVIYGNAPYYGDDGPSGPAYIDFSFTLRDYVAELLINSSMFNSNSIDASAGNVITFQITYIEGQMGPITLVNTTTGYELIVAPPQVFLPLPVPDPFTNVYYEGPNDVGNGLILAYLFFTSTFAGDISWKTAGMNVPNTSYCDLGQQVGNGVPWNNGIIYPIELVNISTGP